MISFPIFAATSSTSYSGIVTLYFVFLPFLVHELLHTHYGIGLIWVSIFRYTQLSHDFNSQSSCASCDCHGYTGTIPENSPEEEYYNLGPKCCRGFEGSQCDLCQTVDVCPSIVENGTSKASTSCSSSSMAPLTIEETTKKFSCSCGGGGDFESNFACPLQGSCMWIS